MPLKTYLLSFLWIIVAFFNGYPQPALGQPLLPVSTVNALQTEVEAFKPEAMPPEYNPELCNRVYQSGISTLIALCLEKEGLSHDMWVRVTTEPDAMLQARNVAILLRAGRRVWLDKEDPFRDDGGDGIRGVRTEYCTQILRRSLSAGTLSRYPLTTRGNRLEVASLFERAIKGKASANPAAPPPSPPESPAKPLQPLPDVPTATPSPSLPAPTVAANPAPMVERKSPVWSWLVGMLALAVIVAVALKRRA